MLRLNIPTYILYSIKKEYAKRVCLKQQAKKVPGCTTTPAKILVNSMDTTRREAMNGSWSDTTVTVTTLHKCNINFIHLIFILQKPPFLCLWSKFQTKWLLYSMWLWTQLVTNCSDNYFRYLQFYMSVYILYTNLFTLLKAAWLQKCILAQKWFRSMWQFWNEMKHSEQTSFQECLFAQHWQWKKLGCSVHIGHRAHQKQTNRGGSVMMHEPVRERPALNTDQQCGVRWNLNFSIHHKLVTVHIQSISRMCIHSDIQTHDKLTFTLEIEGISKYPDKNVHTNTFTYANTKGFFEFLLSLLLLDLT